jgi:hypothetical protein
MEKSEDKIQSECFQWAWNERPETRRCLFAVPNGGKRDKREAMKLKATGVVSGIPDMIFIWENRSWAFELKTETGFLSTNQMSCIDALEKQGCGVFVIRSKEEFEKAINYIINREYEI